MNKFPLTLLDESLHLAESGVSSDSNMPRIPLITFAGSFSILSKLSVASTPLAILARLNTISC